MVDFSRWQERVRAAGDELPTRVRYTRKSSEREDRQIASHDQQMAEMDRKWGEIDPRWWWRESRSGTTFRRREFQDLLDFCRNNPRDSREPGRIEIYDPSRFGRSLDSAGRPDVLGFMSVYHQFEQNGWELHFLTVERTGNQLADVINLAIYAYAAAIYSKNLSDNASRGRREEASKGWWTGGPAPWGTKRMDTRTGRILEDGEKSTPGGGGTILVPIPEILHHWQSAARRLLAGESFDTIGNNLVQAGLRGPRGGALDHSSIKNWMTNEALIGEVDYAVRSSTGTTRAHAKARWEPMVDVELFKLVQKEIARREMEPRNKKRSPTGTFLVRPVCAHCGIEYHGGRWSAGQGYARTYVHGVPKQRLHGELYDRFVEHGCKQYNISADELEQALKDLIVRERTSDEYERDVRAILQEKEGFKANAREAVAVAEARVDSLSAEYRRVVRLATAAGERGLDEEAFFDELQRIQQMMAAARRELEEAQEFARSRQLAWDRLTSVIDETRNLAATWDKVGLEERRVLLDWWVLDVLIVVEPIPGMKRANNKTAIVTLRTAPDAPRYFPVGRQLSSSSDDLISEMTHSSSSTASRARSASTDRSSGIRPKAHAAWPRTRGSSSDSAATNAGTASGDPQFPNATATFRRNPRRLARLTGEPLNLAENSSCESDISSTSGAPCTPGRGMNAGSLVSVENLRENGQTSWQMSQP